MAWKFFFLPRAHESFEASNTNLYHGLRGGLALNKQRSQKFETLLVKFIADANLSANVTEYQSFKALVRFNASDVKDEIKRFKEATMEELPMPNDYAHRRCLQWWAKRRHDYPNLSSMARRAFSVQASSVESERAFSQASLLFANKLRTRLSTKKAEKLLVVKAAVRNEASAPDPEDD
ncbi:hypothetical protein QR680_008156 [Steinernema hermaphroditum]|uniref:HAT C-terminal dimerisation domain-containing protein n=1 Tax=Steinernema hermaphroditum TaxID=289476 RepID=A0AA39IHQ9_9BILA|nr:hypothetical protein QR680_008156 [Steinernema hermaphroditum]